MTNSHPPSENTSTSNKFKRRIEHLASAGDSYILECLQAVEDTFTKLWLERPDKHRLQQLWGRKDHLSTCELFALGRSIIITKAIDSDWLKEIAKKIRKQHTNYHGYITEILLCGSISPNNGTLKPAPQSTSGYDAVAEFKDSHSHFISIKNHDISEHEKDFKIKSFKIHKTLKTLIDREKLSLTITVLVNKMLDETVTAEIIKSIRTLSPITHSQRIESEHYIIKASVISSPHNISKHTNSNHILIVAKQHEREKSRFRKSLIDAVTNIRKHSPQKENTKNLIFMRVHENANLDDLQHLAQEVLSRADSGVDMISLIKPLVSRSENSSVIHHTIKFAIGSRYLEDAKAHRSYTLNIGVGTVSLEEGKLVLTDDSGSHQEIESDSYIYQKGDYYLDMQQQSDGGFSSDLSNPSNGISYHAVANMYNQSMIIKGVFPLNDELLII